MINAGIARVVYDQDYRIRDGVALLHEALIEVVEYGRIAT
jgi:hypothetical protein